MERIPLILFTVFFTLTLNAQQWSEKFEFTGQGKWSDQTRETPYSSSTSDIEQGLVHTLSYPVDVTGLLYPYESYLRIYDQKKADPIRRIMFRILRLGTGQQTPDTFYRWGGFNPYPKNYQVNHPVPQTRESKLGLPIAASLITRHGIEGMTFSCTACHSGNLFGTKVIGLTNRFPRGNEIFTLGKKFSKFAKGNIHSAFLGLNKNEQKMVKDLLGNLDWVKATKPQVLGLDTSLSQVGVSLHYRAQDEFASKVKRRVKKKHFLEKNRADSKPSVWWNLKYKTRWLSDGSVISGNPVHTNILWNEIGRGVDLKELSTWIKDNSDTVEQLTDAVFSTKPPRYENFFGLNSIDIEKAKRGQKLFTANCQKCHGQYLKDWSRGIETTKVRYHKKTPVIDVGTDPYRYQAVKSFENSLNRLQISKENGISIKAQKGYVPPPLVGVWSRWPYFHNNAAPSLCAVLTPGPSRPSWYIARQANDPKKDFDEQCNGYPTKGVKRNRKSEYYYDTKRAGMSNSGHDKKILLKPDGSEKFTSIQKMELIEFLKTL